MNNILIRGCPGTGKTFLARAIAYYLCCKKLTVSDAFNQNPEADSGDINNFFENSKFCEYVQVHPSMDYNDIVYGLQVSADDTLQISYAEKRIMQLCERAKGKTEEYCVILDDINRTDAGRLLGNVLYAMEYRNQDIPLADGKTMSIPENVTLIFTENTLEKLNNLDLAVRRRMTYLKELRSDKNILQKHYNGLLSGVSLKLVLDTYDRVESFINTYISTDLENADDYIPGHGMFMVNSIGTPYYVLDNLRQKVRFQIVPYLSDLYSKGIIIADPERFSSSLISGINTGITGLCHIKEIKKKLVNKGKIVTAFSLADSRGYFNTIVQTKALDYRGMLECIIDAMILNGIFPYDILMGSILTNTNVAYIESLGTPKTKAAYLVKKHEATRYMYETVRGGKISGTHAYYTLDVAVTGRWQSENDTEEYIVSYDDGRLDEEYIPLSGFRNHGFNPSSPDLRVDHNSANIMSAAFRLVEYYFQLYKTNIALIKDHSINDEYLFQLITLEEKYIGEIKSSLTGRGSGPKGDKDRVCFLIEKISHLKLLWYGVSDQIEVDEKKFLDLISGVTIFSLDNYDDIFNFSSGRVVSIPIKGVLKMVDLNDYQKIMENIGIRQMIFQGPPGTSKTFESKRFVLKQLNASSPTLQNDQVTQEDISRALDDYKLTDEDYADPLHSNKLTCGGWDLVQFHPSYGYEDFIRGIEVKIPANSTTPSYSSVNRILGKIAEFAKVAEENARTNNTEIPKFYLIIDEINRANLATVFGELIYGLEYRDSKVSTPYEIKTKSSGITTKDIVIGKNLFIIGTMNTADKSIDAIDYAIRRRFLFVDSPANREVVLKCYQNISGNTDENSIELLLYDAVQSIFDTDRFFNAEYQKSDVKIGHTFFLRNKKRGYEETIIERFVFQVIPIMREYIKDGILEVAEDLIPDEHTPNDIQIASTDEEKISLLAENIMLYVKEFGNLNKSNVKIDNAYVGKFIDDLRKAFSY